MLIEEIQAYLSGELRAMEGGKFLYYPEASPVILQLECIEDGRLLVYSLLALIGWLPCLSSVGRAVIISVPLDNYS